MSDQPDYYARRAIQLDPKIVLNPGTPTNLAEHEAFAHWEALLDAGLIGTKLPTPPDVAAQREANDAVFRRIAADRRAAERAHAWGRNAWGQSSGGVDA
jgi:hypothetical protein